MPMGHPRRYFENNCVYFLTNRLARGLPFVPSEYINNILRGILAKANTKYPNISICHYLWMRNHYHMLIVTNGNPGDIAGFMNLVNGEAAKAVVKFLGRRNVKVWGQRYNCIRLLTSDVVVEKIAYLYLNPVSANLVDKASKWLGVTSYGIEKEQIIKSEYLRPRAIQRLPDQNLTKKLDKDLISKSKKGNTYHLTVKPNKWIECFQEQESIEFYNTQIQSKIRLEENRLKENRKYPVAGEKNQNPHQGYQPQSKGKRMFCMSSCMELRKQFIEIYKNFCERCIMTWQQWKEGNIQNAYPPGGFLPPRWPLANTLKFQT